MPAVDQQTFEVEAPDGTALRGWSQSEGDTKGTPILLAHGITAHRDLVVHGSSHLPRVGYRLLSYDARAHGESDPGAGGYSYETLADDLDTVAGEQGGEGGILVGHSMGSHTILTLALRDPGRWAGLVLIGPASRGLSPDPSSLAYWDSLADGLEQDGTDGWLAAYEAGGLDPEWRETLLRIARARIERHEHPGALADALRAVPRSVPFNGVEALTALELPVLIVASHDDADPGHPYATAELIREQLPEADLISEDSGESPLAWQGGKLSRAIEEFAGSPAIAERLPG